MSDQAHAAQARQLIAEQRGLLSRSIAELGLAVVPSQTNFILVDFVSSGQAAAAFDFLRQRGLVVRPMGGYGLPGCLRITIGTAEQMELTAATLAQWKEGGGG